MSFYDSTTDYSSSGIINTPTSSTTPTCSPTTTTNVSKDHISISPGNQYSWYSVLKIIVCVLQ